MSSKSATSHPHLIFLSPDCGLDKAALSVLLTSMYGEAAVADRPLRLDLTLPDDYTFSFWFEDAFGVAERYTTYLPEGVGRRRLTACEQMIDFHGADDPDLAHAGDAERILAELSTREGVEVFSEEARRFLSMTYVDAAGSAAADEVPDIVADTGAHVVPQAPAQTLPATSATAAPEEATLPAAPPTALSQETPQESPAEEPSETVDEAAEPITAWIATTPATPPAAPPPATPAAEPEKVGIFKRLFGRERR